MNDDLGLNTKNKLITEDHRLPTVKMMSFDDPEPTPFFSTEPVGKKFQLLIELPLARTFSPFFPADVKFPVWKTKRRSLEAAMEKSLDESVAAVMSGKPDPHPSSYNAHDADYEESLYD